jgi:hypothetical protein
LPTSILPDDFTRALQRVGLLPDGLIKRVVITVEPEKLVTMDVEMELDDRIYGIVPELVKDGS